MENIILFQSENGNNIITTNDLYEKLKAVKADQCYSY